VRSLNFRIPELIAEEAKTGPAHCETDIEVTYDNGITNLEKRMVYYIAQWYRNTKFKVLLYKEADRTIM